MSLRVLIPDHRTFMPSLAIATAYFQNLKILRRSASNEVANEVANDVATSPDDAVNLMTLQARFRLGSRTQKPRSGDNSLRQIFRHHDSLRMNRPELPRHTFINRVQHIYRPGKRICISVRR